MEIISNIALISINETLIVQMISFLIFMFIINAIMFRPLNRVMKKRTEYMETLKQDVEDAERAVGRLMDEMEQHEASARREALAVKKEVEEIGSREAAGIFAEARNEIISLKADTKKKVDLQIDQARQRLKKDIRQLSDRIMENVLNRRLVH